MLLTESMPAQRARRRRISCLKTAVGLAMMDIIRTEQPVRCAPRPHVQQGSTGVDAHRQRTACVLHAACLFALLARIDKTAPWMLTPSAPIAPESLLITRTMLQHQARTWRQRASGHVTRATFGTIRSVLRAMCRFARRGSTGRNAPRRQMEFVQHAETTPQTLHLCLACGQALMSMRVSGSAKLATLRRKATA